MGPTCGAIMEPFVTAIGEQTDLPALQIIGGNGAAALVDARTEIDFGSRTIHAPTDADLPRLRPGGSVRDLDVLVLSTDPDEIEAVRQLGEELVGGGLKVSAFGLKSVADLQEQRRRPIRSSARIFLADRYVSIALDKPGDGTAISGFKALYPFRVPIDAETFETFHLMIDGRPPMPTSHPGTTILNYLTRSISGLRAKDAAKVAAMTDNVLTRHPDLDGWIHDGPGSSLFDLARILHTLGEPRTGARPCRLGTRLEIRPYPLTRLDEHEGFMGSDRSRVARRALVEASHVKGRLLREVGTHPAIVGFWQKHIEDRVENIIHNEPSSLATFLRNLPGTTTSRAADPPPDRPVATPDREE